MDPAWNSFLLDCQRFASSICSDDDSAAAFVRSYSSRGANPDAPFILAGVLGGALLVVFLILQVLGHRRRMAELRYKTIENLARHGNLAEAEVERILHPPSSAARGLSVLAWLGLLAGALMMLLSSRAHPTDAETLLVVGFSIAFVSTGLLAIPTVMRELRRQGVLR